MATFHTIDDPPPPPSDTVIDLGTVFVDTRTGKRVQVHSRLEESVKAGVVSRSEHRSRGYVLRDEHGQYHPWGQYKPTHESLLLGGLYYVRDEDQSWPDHGQ